MRSFALGLAGRSGTLHRASLSILTGDRGWPRRCSRWRRFRGGGHCEQLRRACLNKDQLGEQGRGICREYRETCR